MNEYRGETSIILGGKTYELRLTTNRMAHLERMLECRGLLPGRLLGAGADTVRAVFHVCLTVPLKKGADPLIKPPFTLDDMGDLMDESGLPTQKGPISYAYWELLVAAGIVDREDAEKAGLVPVRKIVPKVVDVPVLELVEPVAIAGI